MKKLKLAVKVPIIQNRSAWGSIVDDYMVCLTKEDADKFITEFNTQNNLEHVPGWYTYASNSIEPVNLTDTQYNKIKRSKEKRYWLSSLS